MLQERAGWACSSGISVSSIVGPLLRNIGGDIFSIYAVTRRQYVLIVSAIRWIGDRVQSREVPCRKSSICSELGLCSIPSGIRRLGLDMEGLVVGRICPGEFKIHGIYI
jgi:hypothetical protein